MCHLCTIAQFCVARCRLCAIEANNHPLGHILLNHLGIAVIIAVIAVIAFIAVIAVIPVIPTTSGV